MRLQSAQQIGMLYEAAKDKQEVATIDLGRMWLPIALDSKRHLGSEFTRPIEPTLRQRLLRGALLLVRAMGSTTTENCNEK